jgi:hypothetical protein
MLMEDRKFQVLKISFNFPEISDRKGEKSRIRLLPTPHGIWAPQIRVYS